MIAPVMSSKLRTADILWQGLPIPSARAILTPGSSSWTAAGVLYGRILTEVQGSTMRRWPIRLRTGVISWRGYRFLGDGNNDIWVLKLDSTGSIGPCPFEGISTALITDTSASVIDTDAVPITSTATVQIPRQR